MNPNWNQYYRLLAPYIHSFIPIFVAMDIIGMIPLYTGMTSAFPPQVRRKIAVQAIATAFIIAIAFLFVGKAVFSLLGITVADFQIAGGALLFIVAIVDILAAERPGAKLAASEIGVVPLGTPLLVGPAVLTVLIMMVDLYGLLPTMVSIVVNLGIVAAVLFNAHRILKFMGESGAKGTAKVISLLLAAIGVMMIRRGIISIILQVWPGLAS
jgi:multiple antibiotic resistance protein